MDFKEIGKHLRLLIRPTIAGVLVSLVWYYMFFNVLYFVENDEPVFSNVVLNMIGMFHAIIAGGVLNKVWDDFKKVMHCVKEEDQAGFTKLRDEKIPPAIHLLLAVMSIVIQWLLMNVHQESAYSGINANFCVAFVLALYWEVATNLDDVHNGIWYRGKIKPEWLKK
jgi:hypothetical protein